MADPVAAYNSGAWTAFFSAEVGAAAALTGLLFVAVSINLSKIVALPLLVSRAAKALSTLLAILLAATICLVPAQSNVVLGWELTIVGALGWLIITASSRRSTHNNPYISGFRVILHDILAQFSSLPLILCGVSLVLGHGGGFYWLFVGVLFSFATALLDAWVLLIEIHR